MKYFELYQDYIYKQYNMTRKKPTDKAIICFVIAIIIIFAAVNIRPKLVTYAEKVQESIERQDDFVDELTLREKEARERAARQAQYEAIVKSQAKQKEELTKELNENFTKGDWIIITWWMNPSSGPTAPEGTSKTGQIRKIVDDKIYGTWGDNPLTYKQEVWHRCSHKEYLEARQKEQSEKDKKAKKKEFKSWGLYPGTVKSK
ncbi:MAG: hypothetical protein IJ790_00760 [Lachnospiraceae bacterium]|nr:hypothetical protein [Lachnospiraceae bacterium]